MPDHKIRYHRPELRPNPLGRWHNRESAKSLDRPLDFDKQKQIRHILPNAVRGIEHPLTQPDKVYRTKICWDCGFEGPDQLNDGKCKNKTACAKRRAEWE